MSPSLQPLVITSNGLSWRSARPSPRVGTLSATDIAPTDSKNKCIYERQVGVIYMFLRATGPARLILLIKNPVFSSVPHTPHAIAFIVCKLIQPHSRAASPSALRPRLRKNGYFVLLPASTQCRKHTSASTMNT